ncbi:peptide transporter MTD1 [Penicillium chermesinum]|uniref:Peptide transporter MTD1 n=1 Tax=Penicillium chermesinum TaxID=63820 RepID=A0A9W9P8C8_9EURO|nr:peptide transporter MTD1 [Penicillium chermesinum]KAJ5238423.1 peptide transporter MTD1 [Penicillium chermesinum]
MAEQVSVVSEQGYQHLSKKEINTPELESPEIEDKLPHDAKATELSSSDEGDAAGFQGDDKEEYVKGHPVIRNGLDVSKFLVSTRDDGDPSLTFRSIVLGTLFTALSSVITMLYTFKPYQVQVSAVFLQLLVFVFGELWAVLTPSPDRFNSKWLQATLRFLNFGQKFQIKEHVIASLIASSGNNGLSGIEVFAVERLLYDKVISASTAVLGTFSITLCGFVLAGLLRPLIVYPAEMVYWSTLPQVILFQSLHFDRKANKARLKKFVYALTGSAIWELFPAYIIPWVGGVSIFCLASMGAPTSTRTTFSNIFGGASSNEGMGLLNFSFDWQYIQSAYLSFPLKQQFNTWIGYLIWYPAQLGLYYSNKFDAKKYPFMSTALYASNGTTFSTVNVLNDHGIVDEAKLHAIGLPHLTSSTIWGFFTQNLGIGALISHVLLFYAKDMALAWKQARSRKQPDPHYQGMLKYKEVPLWWYLVLAILSIVAGIIVNAKGETTLPVWAYIVALILGAFIAPFSCILYGLYGTGVSTNQISKMVAGAVVPGRPLAGLYFASWSHQVILLAVNLANWLKVGQYTKVSHRVMFATQIYGTLLGAALNYAVMITIVTNQREILLDPKGNSVWSGSLIQSLNSQATTWALAKDMYSLHGDYFIVPLGLLIGFALPFVHWGLNRLFPLTRKWPINTPIIAIMPGRITMVWLRRRHPGIYNKYNYLIGAALDGGSQIVIFILSFAVFGAGGKPRPFPTWWGNPQR